MMVEFLYQMAGNTNNRSNTMSTETEEITIKVDQDHYKQIEAVATLRRISVEQLVDETMGSYIASVNVSLGELSRNIFKQ